MVTHPGTTKGRPTLQLNPEIEATLRTTYDGSATCVRNLAQQYGVAESTVRAWAHKLGLTQRSRPRPQSGQEKHYAWKLAAHYLDEDQEPALVPDREMVTVSLLRTYLNEMGSYPRLTALQERQLGERSAQGDQDAKYGLVLANLRLVVRIAKHYAAKSMYSLPLLDLIQEGTLGLIHAADTYDVHRGWRFSTHATWWIRQAVSRAQMEQSRTVRLPVGVQAQIQDISEILQNTHEDLPLQAITEQLSISSERAQELLIASQPIYSLDAPAFGESGELEISDLLESPLPTPQDHIESMDLRHQLLDLVQTLRSKRDRQVITLRYGLDGKGERTLEEVGKQLHVTKERIRQIEMRVLQELKKEAEKMQLQEYLSA
jgi:RNA polymerase primary sigma factor